MAVTLHCFGDSHVWVMQGVDEAGLLPDTRFRIVGVGGATAFGLANPNSTTDALRVFADAVAAVPEGDPVLFMLGEIDVGFLVWLRARAHGTTVDDEIDDSLRRYRAFLTDVVLSRPSPRLFVVAVGPPMVEDYRTWAGLDNARREVTASLAERTAATRRYNEALAAWAGDHGVGFVDVFSELVDESTGLIAERFRNPDPLDHHFPRGPFADVMARALRGLGFS